MGFFKDAVEQSPARNVARMHAWIWGLIYGGLLLLVFGLATRPFDELVGWILVAVGGVAAVVGFALIWVRSRMFR